MHPECVDFVRRCRGKVGQPARVLEFGSRWINGGVRPFFPDSEFFGIDIAPGDGVDLVADASVVHLPDFTADVVICTEVLEHVPPETGELMIANAYRHLAPGGFLILTAATAPRARHSGHDGGELNDGEYYGNVDPARLVAWLSPFERVQVEIDHVAGDVRALAMKARGSSDGSDGG